MAKRFLRSLLVGIDYEGTSSVLKGCSQDVENMRSLIKKNYKVNLLCDDPRVKGSIAMPTTKNVLNQLTLMRKELNENKNSQFLFHYSGHGTYTHDSSGDEKDGQDELIYCLDGPVTDDLINETFFQKLNPDVSGLVLMDCCFSGTICDLKYVYDKSVYMDNARDETKADIVVLSGCTDAQTSADAYINGNFQGAMTASFLNVINGTSKNVKTVADDVRKYLIDNGYSQRPLVSFVNETSLNKGLDSYLKI